MKLTERDDDSILSVSPDFTNGAGPSFTAGPSNGHGTNGHGPSINGSSTTGLADGFPVHKRTATLAPVSLAGTTLYDDSPVDREEFVRLVIQSLRDIGYIEAAATLEAESGYDMESPEVAAFRQSVLDASWDEAERALETLGFANEDGIWEARFLIRQQKYLELLEADQTSAALHVLRSELTPLNIATDVLNSLSSLLMCADSSDLRLRATWDGASDASRRRLLSNLQRHIPSSVMIPPRRFSTLLLQALSFQRQQCVYHNSPSPSPLRGASWANSASRSSFSLYVDHFCDRDTFPRTTSLILEGHSDEVWNLQWSHDGTRLATASRDKTAIIWRIGTEVDATRRTGSRQFILQDHEYPVGCLAWSLDDSRLLTSAEQYIKMWNTQTGEPIATVSVMQHTDTVTALSWLPNGTGFISGALDRRIMLWNINGNEHDSWGTTAIRVTDLAVTPDMTRVVAVGMHHRPSLPPVPSHGSGTDDTATPPGTSPATGDTRNENRMIIYDLQSKQTESSIRFEGELTSVSISQDSRYALVNHSPDEILLWDMTTSRMARKFTGQRQGRHVIRSCFGGIDDNFVVSGSEDAKVYIWHRDTGTVLETLSGHGSGSVNSVAWNPANERMLASCSDDSTVRIWEALPAEQVAEDRAAQLPGQVDGKGKGKSREQPEEARDGFSPGPRL